ncbi:hypothetical protein TWF106_011648 [Orbilia oligospora]|uniref:Tetraspanin Tsp3 n=1 Tax=Orbilia oligospora TaxID=2813651 RepID=A0A7C8Q0W6_ORBOL|nr:hypothetical protein TWF788_001491 [Orbilia oligospora]KAF3207629.1 hypothetical protein TWF106_011648 [Orbilia oligospora]
MRYPRSFLVLVSLFAGVSVLGVFAWFTAWRYRLPFTVLPILTAILGPADLLTTYRSLGIATSRKASKRPLSAFPLAINLALLILPSVLIALAAPNLSGASKCQLKDTWQAWYSAHDKDAIKGVQDALQCCGFGKVTEMPFPFYKGPKVPGKGHPPEVPTNTCSIALGRDVPCAPVWEGELKLAAGLVVAATAITLLVKFAFFIIILARPGFAERWFSKQKYDGYDNTRTIENLGDDYEEPEDNEPPTQYETLPTHRTTPNLPAIEGDVNETTGLMLARDHNRGGNQAPLDGHSPWASHSS